MPPANPNIIAIRPRTLAHVLLDLKEAKRDWEQADRDAQLVTGDARLEDECGDRMSEADTRIDDLRAEFAEMFQRVTGLTWKQIEEAVSEAVL